MVRNSRAVPASAGLQEDPTRRAFDPEAFNAFEAAAWGRAGKARHYAAALSPMTDGAIAPLLDAAGVEADARVLDVGTGPGDVAAQAAARGAVVTAIDLSEEMLAFAAGRHPRVHFSRADAQDLPFEDASFDAAVANFAILHLGRRDRALAHLARVLAPRGRLAITAWDEPERCRAYGVLLDAVRDAGVPRPAHLPLPPADPVSDADYVGMLTRVGFEQVTVCRVEYTHVAAGPDQYWNGMLAAGVRVPPTVLGHPVAVQRRIRAEYDRLVSEYTVDGRLLLPVSVVLVSGRVPDAGSTPKRGTTRPS